MTSNAAQAVPEMNRERKRILNISLQISEETSQHGRNNRNQLEVALALALCRVWVIQYENVSSLSLPLVLYRLYMIFVLVVLLLVVAVVYGFDKYPLISNYANKSDVFVANSICV